MLSHHLWCPLDGPVGPVGMLSKECLDSVISSSFAAPMDELVEDPVATKENHKG